MINKQNLWFLTLFSLILVLSIYYITMPDSLLESIKANNSKEVVNIHESDSLAALRVESEEEMLSTMQTLQEALLDDSKSALEKSQAYDSLKELNLNKGKEAELEKKIKETFNLDCFIKVKNDQIKVTVSSKDHSETLANNIIRTIQGSYDKQMYITVKFQG